MSLALTRNTSGVRRAIALIIVALIAVTSFTASQLAASTSPANAASNPTGSSIRQNQTFYAYLNASHNLDVTFTKTMASTGNAAIRITSPTGAVTNCTIGLPSGSMCSRMNLTSTVAGIWTIDFYGTDNLQIGLHRWDITVQNGTTNLPGRVWSDKYIMYNSYPIDVPLWYVAPTGYKYAVTSWGYYGIDSIFRANQFGNVFTGTCTPAYQSIESKPTSPFYDPSLSPNFGGCGQPYHVFFEQPAAGLPATAVDGFGNTRFVAPPVQNPTLGQLTFAPDAPGTRAGTFSFPATNAVGNATLLIDADGDGVFTGTLDRSIPLAIHGDGTQTYDFDGLDSAGNPISVDVELRGYIQVAKAGEIHLLAEDVESRLGITMTALNGPAAGSSTIYWNDSKLQTAQRLPCIPGTLDATAGVNSSGTNGRHGWNCFGQPGINPNDGVTGAWGDSRSIDDWTFHPVNIVSNTVIVPAESRYTVTKTSDPAPGTTVKPGDTITYTLTVNQSGPAEVEALLSDDLTDVLDDADLVGSVTASIGTAAVTGGTLTWSGTVPVGGQATVSYTVKVKDQAALAEGAASGNADNAYSLGNVVTSDGCQVADACETTHPVGTYAVVKSSDPASGSSVSGGEAVKYTVTVTQVGTGAVTGASLTDDLSDVLDDASWNDDLAATSDTASFSDTAQELTWTGDLAVGQVVTITYSVDVTSFGNGAGPGDDALLNVITSDGCADTASCSTEHEVVPKLVTVQVLKVGEDSSGTVVPMDGSQWALYDSATATTPTVAQIPGAGSTGLFRDVTLPAGTYWLEETQALPGFELLAERVQFTVDFDGQVTLAAGGSVNVSVIDGADLTDRPDLAGIPTIQVEDVPSMDLPEAGGSGVTTLYVAGGALIATSLLLLVLMQVLLTRRRAAQSQPVGGDA